MKIGIDEVGRGAWAGPLLVVAASGTPPPTIKDSKILSKIKRQELIRLLQKTCSFGEGWVGSGEIDSVGLAEAMRLGVHRALSSLGASSDDEIIMDGPVNYCSPDFVAVQTIIKADQSQPLVSAASVYAKVLRDEYMAKLEQEFPGYDFVRHVGYGTAKHTLALSRLGPCIQHRHSFKPIKTFL